MASSFAEGLMGGFASARGDKKAREEEERRLSVMEALANRAPPSSGSTGAAGAPGTATAPPAATGAGNAGGDWLRYSNSGAIRNQPLSDDLVSALSFLPDMGISMEVFSGGQTGDRRTGSTRHNDGGAADVRFYKDGRMLDWRNPDDIPIYQDIVRRARAAGVTGFGAGDGYMSPGSMHIGYGNPAVWGAGGKGANAPGWLREAWSSPAAPASAGATVATVPPSGPAEGIMPQTPPDTTASVEAGRSGPWALIRKIMGG